MKSLNFRLSLFEDKDGSMMSWQTILPHESTDDRINTLLVFTGTLHRHSKCLDERTRVLPASGIAFTVSSGTVSIYQDLFSGTGWIAFPRNMAEIITCEKFSHHSVRSHGTLTNVKGTSLLNSAVNSFVGNSSTCWLRGPDQIGGS